MVIASHGVPAQVAPWLRAVGPHGVHVFFVISGFLITGKLLEEESSRGRIGLSEFYLRRAFRILPAALAFLTAVAALGASGVLAPMPWKEWLVDAFFLTSYVGRFPGRTPYTGHFWSLAVEEHFYLLFPFLLALAGSRRLRWILPALLAAAPLWRFADAAFVDLHGRAFPGVSPEYRTDRVFDLLLFGCGLALLFRDERWRARLSRWLGTPALVALGAALVVLVWREGPISLEGLCISGLLAGTVLHPEAPLGRVLELEPMKWIGRLSYSAYLWQQLFFVAVMREPEWPQRFPLNAALLLAIALASYHLVEQPMIQLGRQVVAWSARHVARPPAALALVILVLSSTARAADPAPPPPPNPSALQAELRQMLSSATVAPGLGKDAAKVEEVTPPVNGWVAARIGPTYRDFPNVVLFHWDAARSRWSRVPEGLALGICHCVSGIMDLHTGDSDNVLDMTLGKEPIAPSSPKLRAMVKELNVKGAVASLYPGFLHVHPAGKATYFLDKTWLDHAGPKLLGRAYQGMRRRECATYDALPLRSVRLAADGGALQLTAQSMNDQRWTVRWTGVDADGWLADKAVDAETRMTPGSAGVEFIDPDTGLVPGYLTPGGPAERAFDPRDVVLAIDGLEVTEAADANRRVQGAPGSKVKVMVLRDGREVILTLVRAFVAPAP